MPRVVTMTLNPALDKSIHVTQVVPERKLRSDRPIHEPGGGGINVARVLHALGVHADAHWTCGGHTGERLAGLLDATGIEHHPLAIDGETREHLIVFETSTGYQFRFGTPGPILLEAELTAMEARIRGLQADTPYLVLSGSLPDSAPEDTYARLVASAPASTRVILDTSGGALAHALDAGGVFLAKPNQRELEALAGRPVEDDASLMEAARSLIDRDLVEVVVTSLGAGGALAVTKERAWHVRAPAVRVLSAVGAGDSMVAGMVAALLWGRPLVGAIRYGVAAGAAAVTTPGTELCRLEDIERFDAQMAADQAD
jgi:6-phosphofructokinase 2